MSPSYFVDILFYLFNESNGRLIFPQKSSLLLLNEFQKQPYNWVIRFTLVIIINNVCVSKYAYANEFQKQPYNWVIRFTLVIIINNVCVSKYAYAAITILNGILKTYIFHLQVPVILPNKLENDLR